MEVEKITPVTATLEIRWNISFQTSLLTKFFNMERGVLYNLGIRG